MYRVAMASTDNRHVDQHFGRAESFLIVDVDDEGNYEEIEQRFVTPICGGGHHDQSALKRGVEALLDCNIVVAAKIGPGAYNELLEHNLNPFEFTGEVGDVLERLDKYLKLLEEMNNYGL